MVATQASGAAPLATAVEAGDSSPVEIDDPSTVASGISAPFAGQHPIDAIRESGGTAIGVDDAEIVDGVTTLARTTGIWPESASATVIPALEYLADCGEIARDDIVVLTITGSGHKHAEPVKSRLGDVPTVARDSTAIASAFVDTR